MSLYEKACEMGYSGTEAEFKKPLTAPEIKDAKDGEKYLSTVCEPCKNLNDIPKDDLTYVEKYDDFPFEDDDEKNELHILDAKDDLIYSFKGRVAITKFLRERESK